MTILDFFDINNVDHLAAWDYLGNNGHWPDGFLPDDLEVPPPLWQVALVGWMAEAWVTACITGKVKGIPALDKVE